MGDRRMISRTVVDSARFLKMPATSQNLYFHLDWLKDAASTHGEKEVLMVDEIYETICDMVCNPRDKVTIKNTDYPWTSVKSQFLKLNYQHIANILNRIVDADLKIKNMNAYLISTLYTESMSGVLAEAAEIHDDYLKYLRGQPY